MSYILDALRRAEADRQRGQVPHLGVAQLASASADTAQPRRLKLAVTVVLCVLAVSAAGGLGWWRGAALPSKPPLSPLSPLAQEQALKAQVGAVPDLAASTSGRPWPQVVSAPPATLPAAPLSGASAKTAAPQAPVSATASNPTPAFAQAPSPERPSVARPTKVADLTPDQRRELPTLVVNGSVWSDSAASRFVILNGQVLREGDAAAPGVVVEKLLPKSALLRWRGQLLELPL